MERTREAMFEILVREHETALLAFVRSGVHDQAAAEDIVQEAFLVAWRKLGEYNESRPFAAWLRGIAQNKILEYVRDRATANHHVRAFSAQFLTEIAEEMGRLIRGRGDTLPATLAALRGCLATLPPGDREVVERAYRQGETCRAIAAVLGEGVEWAKKRLQRARRTLRDCIREKLAAEDSDD